MRDPADGLAFGHDEIVVFHQGVGEPLQEDQLLLLTQGGAVVDLDAALLVPADQQQLERCVEEALAVLRQIHVAVLVERAQQTAQQRARGEPPQFRPGVHQLGEAAFALIEPPLLRAAGFVLLAGGVVPACDQVPDAFGAEGEQVERVEIRRVEPVLRYGEGPGGHDIPGVGVGHLQRSLT
jgi:hypothetical protein